MESVFKFNFPEDKAEFIRMSKADNIFFACEAFSQYLRAEYKWNDKLTEDQVVILEAIREKFFEILEEHNINLDEDIQ
jgi:uncharacterized protein involved in tolerance to divalent cations